MERFGDQSNYPKMISLIVKVSFSFSPQDMRNIIILAGLAGMAGIVLGDGGHPYQYETAVGWGDHSALVSNRQSPNPLRSRQAALAAILTPGVFAAIVSVSNKLPGTGSSSGSFNISVILNSKL